ncbi:hypothetical protein GN956_G12690 [Arapaima gigas]
MCDLRKALCRSADSELFVGRFLRNGGPFHNGILQLLVALRETGKNWRMGTVAESGGLWLLQDDQIPSSDPDREQRQRPCCCRLERSERTDALIARCVTRARIRPGDTLLRSLITSPGLQSAKRRSPRK